MSQLTAKQLIAENKRTQAKSLDLGNCGLTNLNEIPELFDCVWLEELILSNEWWEWGGVKWIQKKSVNTGKKNQLSEVSIKMRNLENLKKLVLAGEYRARWKIKDIRFLRNLACLEVLDVRNNQIKDIRFLKNLTHLQTLYLSNNEISDIRFLKNLINLQTLYLSNNQIVDIRFLEKLTKLRTLYLSYNQISNICFLEKLTKLQTLDLRNNQIVDIRFLEKLAKLQTLYLGSNQISDISFLEKLTGLQTLYLRSNQISDIRPLLPLIQKEIYLFLDENPITPPLEIVRQGNQAILNYFKELDEGSETVYEAKLLIIGEAGVGKTTLKRRIEDHNAPMPSNEEDTTVGIDISEYIFKAREDLPEFTMDTWDFGGQEVYHSTHQFFLSKRSLYVLVDDGRTEDHNRYWMQVQELFGQDSPLLILVNKKGKIQRQIAIEELKGNFPNLQDVHTINLQSDIEKIKDYRHILEHYIRHLPQYQKGEKLPTRWVEIRKVLEDINEDYITLKEFRALCSEKGMHEPQSQDFLSDYLHDLGVLLHFRDLKHPSLQKIVILRPEWATNAVYAILNHTKEKGSNGEFGYEDLNEVWDSSDYQDLFGELLALMQKFELCYRLPHNPNRFIVPQLLPLDKAQFTWKEGEDLLQMRYEYDFMPKGILTRFIVRLHEHIEHPTTVWQRGVVLNHQNTRALVVEEYREEAISIRIQGSHPQVLIPIILKEIDDINKGFHFNERMRVRKLVPCICGICKSSVNPELYEYRKLMEVLEKGKGQFYCNTGFEFFDIQAALFNIGSTKEGILEEVGLKEENRVASKREEMERKREVEKRSLEEKRQREEAEKEKQATNSILPYIALTILLIAIAAFVCLPDLRSYITVGFGFVIAVIGVLNLFKK